MEGSQTENYVFAGISVLLVVVYVFMTLMNAFGECLGSPGRRFIFEMDEVMGGLLGIPHYSKLEAPILLFTSIGFVLTWFYDPVISFVSVLGILTGTVYMFICVIYAYFAKQAKMPFLITCLVDLGLLIWRCVRFLDPDYHVAVGVIGGVGLLISLVSFFVMKTRAERCSSTIEKFIQIQNYEQTLKAKNEKLIWLKGKSAPEGFESS